MYWYRYAIIALALQWQQTDALARLATRKRPSPSSINAGCVAKFCAKDIVPAMADLKFLECSKCELGCAPFYYNDTSPMKLQYQNCTTKCALTYESPAGDAFLGCAMEHNCVTFAPLNTTCPAPKVDAGASLGSLEGEWWQQYGHNALWDCYDCQHIHKMFVVNDSKWCGQTIAPDGPVQAPCWSYTYSYDLYTETGTQYFQQTWQLPHIEVGKPIGIFYTYMGSTHNETWYLLKATPRYVVLLDCSYMSNWINVGSIVWVRPNITLTSEEMQQIRAVYTETVGWTFPDDFCADKHGKDHCVEPTTFTQPMTV